MSITRGRRLAILGSNGAGKTTLLLHLNGTSRPSSGRVLLDGEPAAYTLADDVALFDGGTVIARGEAETVLADAKAPEATHLRPPLLLEPGLKARAFGWLDAGNALPRCRQDMLDPMDVAAARPRRESV